MTKTAIALLLTLMIAGSAWADPPDTPPGQSDRRVVIGMSLAKAAAILGALGLKPMTDQELGDVMPREVPGKDVRDLSFKLWKKGTKEATLSILAERPQGKKDADFIVTGIQLLEADLSKYHGKIALDDALKVTDLQSYPPDEKASPAQPAYTASYDCQIKAIGKDTLDVHVLRGHSGIIHPVNVDDKTVVVLLNGQPGKLSDLKVGQWVKVYTNTDPNDDKRQRVVKIEPGMPWWAAQRLADLEKNAASLEIAVKALFDVEERGNLEELYLLGPDHPGGYKEPFFARLTKDEMTRLLRYLAVEGFLAGAADRKILDKTPRPPAPPYLSLSVGDLFEWSPLGPETVKRLEGIKSALPEKAAAKMEALLLPRVRKITGVAAGQPAAAQPDVVKSVADLSSDDGAARVAATKAIFALGKDALEPLTKAGAKQITPSGPASGRRIDMVYSLLDGLKLGPLPNVEGYHRNGFKLVVDKGCTIDDVKKMGERHGFTIPWNFDRNGHAFLDRGKDFADTIRAILATEPKIVTVELEFFTVTP